MGNANEEHLLTVTELAGVLNVPPSWIYQRTRQGPKAIPFMRIGRYVRFDPERVKSFFMDKTKNMNGHEMSKVLKE